jgi:hypothetical protein
MLGARGLSPRHKKTPQFLKLAAFFYAERSGKSAV